MVRHAKTGGRQPGQLVLARVVVSLATRVCTARLLNRARLAQMEMCAKITVAHRERLEGVNATAPTVSAARIAKLQMRVHLAQVVKRAAMVVQSPEPQGTVHANVHLATRVRTVAQQMPVHPALAATRALMGEAYPEPQGTVGAAVPLATLAVIARLHQIAMLLQTVLNV